MLRIRGKKTNFNIIIYNNIKMLHDKLGKDINSIINKYLYFKPKPFMNELLNNTFGIKVYLNLFINIIVIYGE
jgi:hypothetical protein